MKISVATCDVARRGAKRHDVEISLEGNSAWDILPGTPPITFGMYHKTVSKTFATIAKQESIADYITLKLSKSSKFA